MVRYVGVACVVVLLAASLLGCGGDDEVAPPSGGLPSCPQPEVALPDGSCIWPGIPADGCAEGFVHDGEYGCEPILPPEPCPFGLMAAPGETLCRPVMDCGAGRWGDIPVDGATVYVEAGYVGGGSDGSDARPFTSIGAAIAAAAPGALIAVAEGRYQEDVVIEGKPLRLWGRCPEKVEVVGTGLEVATLNITTQAAGTVVGGLAVGGPAIGVSLSGSEDVALERLWVRQSGRMGVTVGHVFGVTSARLSRSLVEQSRQFGVYVTGATAVIDETVVRGTLPTGPEQIAGCGINIQPACTAAACDLNQRSTATVRGSLVEDNRDIGILVLGSDASIDSSVVRRTSPRATDQQYGIGIAVENACLESDCGQAGRSTTDIHGSLVELSHDVGLGVAGSDATVESTVVRDTWPRPSDQRFGLGINVQGLCNASGCDSTTRSTMAIRRSLVEQNHENGLLVTNSDATIEGIVLRDTLPRAYDQTFGRGIHIQPLCIDGICDPAARSTAVVRGSLVAQNHDIGLLLLASDATVESTVVRDTMARAADGLYGDGVLAVGYYAEAKAALSTLLVDSCARAGVASFGAGVSLSSSVVRCAAFALNGEPYDGRDFVFEDGGNNTCGCPEANGPCKVLSAGLAPPDALPEE